MAHERGLFVSIGFGRIRLSCLPPSVVVRGPPERASFSAWYFVFRFPSLTIPLSLDHFFLSPFMTSYCFDSLLFCLHFLSHDASTVSLLRSLPLLMFSCVRCLPR